MPSGVPVVWEIFTLPKPGWVDSSWAWIVQYSLKAEVWIWTSRFSLGIHLEESLIHEWQTWGLSKYPLKMFLKISVFCLFTPLALLSCPRTCQCWQMETWHLMQTQCCSGIKTIYNNWLLALCLKQMANTPMKMSFVKGSKIITVHTSEDCSETSKKTPNQPKNPSTTLPPPFLPKHHGHHSFEGNRKGEK